MLVLRSAVVLGRSRLRMAEVDATPESVAGFPIAAPGDGRTPLNAYPEGFPGLTGVYASRFGPRGSVDILGRLGRPARGPSSGTLNWAKRYFSW